MKVLYGIYLLGLNHAVREQIIVMEFLPIFTNKEASMFELEFMRKNKVLPMTLVRQAGESIAHSICSDIQSMIPETGTIRVLLLVGKGSNGADALVVATKLLELFGGRMNITVIALKKDFLPLTDELYKLFLKKVRDTLGANVRTVFGLFNVANEPWFKKPWTLCIDGFYGLRCNPFDEMHQMLFHSINNHPDIAFRAAIDIPSGLGDELYESATFRADVTYVTGTMKWCLLDTMVAATTGRLKFIDIGFFDEDVAIASETAFVSEKIINRLVSLRPMNCDKRDFGHVLFVGGSKKMSGAAQLSMSAILHSGVGLLTGCVPESIVDALRTALPEAMWRPWEETEEGELALDGLNELLQELSKYSAIVLGPGAGRSKETQMLFHEILNVADCPVICDADALQPDILPLVKARYERGAVTVLTPHHGEYSRLFGEDNFFAPKQAVEWGVYVVLKGPITRICNGDSNTWESSEGNINEGISTWGSPVLARGGSGDILSGLIGGLLAQKQASVFKSICAAVCWQGLASRSLARIYGERAVRSSDILEHLSKVLKRS